MATLSGCLLTEPSEAGSARLDASYLAPAVRSYLGPNGLLQYPIPDAGEGSVSLSAALQLYTGFIGFARTAVGNFREYIEGQRGRPIDWANIMPCGRVFLARSLYEPLPNGPLFSLWRKAYGSDWQLEACDLEGDVVFRTQLAASTSVRIADGELQLECYPRYCIGGDFASYGLPPLGQRPDYSPEAAIQAAYRVSAVPIAALPDPQRYVTVRGPFTSTIGMRWRIELEKPIAITRIASGLRDTTRILYYVPRCKPGLLPCLQVAQRDQPAPYEFTSNLGDPYTGEPRSTIVRLIPRLPLLLEDFEGPLGRPRR